MNLMSKKFVSVMVSPVYPVNHCSHRSGETTSGGMKALVSFRSSSSSGYSQSLNALVARLISAHFVISYSPKLRSHAVQFVWMPFRHLFSVCLS